MKTKEIIYLTIVSLFLLGIIVISKQTELYCTKDICITL